MQLPKHKQRRHTFKSCPHHQKWDDRFLLHSCFADSALSNTLSLQLAIMVDMHSKKVEGPQRDPPVVSRELKQTTPGLRTLLGIYPIRRHLIQYLDTRDLLNLCRTSWATRLDIKTNSWNINDRLLHFFKNPMAFRSHLGR